MIIGNRTGTRGDSADAPWSCSAVDVRSTARRRRSQDHFSAGWPWPDPGQRARRQRAQPLLIKDGPESGASNFGDQELHVLVTAKVDGTFYALLKCC
jgi:hypothetical protein